MGCWGQKIAVLQGLALITTSSPSSSYLGRRPASGQQPRWKVPLPRAGRGADNGGGIHYKGTHTHTHSLSTAGCHMGWRDPLRRQQLPPHSLRCWHLPPLPALMGNRFGGKRQQGTGLSKKGRALCSTQASNLTIHHTEKKPFSI